MRSPRTSFPLLRLDCSSTPRPCPHVGCVHNTYLTVSAKGKLQISRPGLEPEDVPEDESCSLDVASEGPQTLERVGQILGVTRERVRQIEIKIMGKILEAIGESARSKK